MRLAMVAVSIVLPIAGVVGQVDPAFDDTRLKVPSAELHLFFQKQPAVVEGVLMVPLRAIERWLKTTADGHSGNQFSFAYYGETKTPIAIRMWVGEKRAVLGRMEVPLDAAPQTIKSELYLPLRFIAEAVGIWVDALDHKIRLKKPDLNWECWLAIPPHPQSLEGKMVALAVAREPDTLKRVENVGLSADTNSGQVVIAQPPSGGDRPVRYVLTYRRDATGWHFVSQAPFAP